MTKSFSLFVVCLAVAMGAAGVKAHAEEIRLLSANVFTGVVDELAVDFERSSGHKVVIVYGNAGAIFKRIQAGEFGDVTILPRPMLEQLSQQGRITPGITDLARSAVAVVVRGGAPKPDVGSVEAFKRAMQAAKSISYPDPKLGGATGVLMTRDFEQLGMTDEMKPKTRFPPEGQFAVEVLERGEVEIAIAQPMEVLVLGHGLEIAGLLPPELQDPPNFTFSAAVLSGAKVPAASGALVQFLSGPKAKSLIKQKGMNPS